MKFFHGGKAGLNVGDALVPSPPHVEDGCPVCIVRREGRALTVGEYRRWLMQFGVRAEPVLRALADAADWEPMDPPSAQNAVYITTDEGYATWYAARSGGGDLYEVIPDGEPKRTTEDHFPSFTVKRAIIRRVVRRHVVLARTERRQLLHRWKKADRRASVGRDQPEGETALRARCSTLEDAAFHFQTCTICKQHGEDSCESGRRFTAFLCGKEDWNADAR